MWISEHEMLQKAAECLFIERMNLQPEVHVTLSVTLESLRWFKLICQQDKISFNEITPEFLMQKLTGLEVSEKDLLMAKGEIEECIRNGNFP